MTVTLRPEDEQFVVEQVKAGHFPSEAAVIQAALADMAGAQRVDPLDDEDWAAIAESDAEFDRGEGIPLATLKADYSKRYGLDL